MWKPGMETSDQWVASTASLPVAFAQVREDPRIDGRLVEQLGRSARVLMIASGGETAAMLATMPIESLRIIDPNPAQIALTKLKLSMLADLSTEQRLQLLGHYAIDPAGRGQEIIRRLEQLGLEKDVLGPIELIAEFGPDYCARYEWVFARLRECLSNHQHAVRHLMSLSHPGEQARSVAAGSELGDAFEHAFGDAMELSKLVQIFGAEATANRVQPFSEHFLQQTRRALERFPASENPFLHQIFPRALCWTVVGLAGTAQRCGSLPAAISDRLDGRRDRRVARSEFGFHPSLQHFGLGDTATGNRVTGSINALFGTGRHGRDSPIEFDA